MDSICFQPSLVECIACDGDACLLKEKWISIVHDTANKHWWDGCSRFKKCEHHNLTTDEVRDTPWLKVGSLKHKALQDVVFDKRFLKDMVTKTEFHHTGQLEVFHCMMLKYVPKRENLSYQGMVARTQLAALDHNYNLNRSQPVISNENDEVGEERYKVVFPKGCKVWVAKCVVNDKSYDLMLLHQN